MIVENREKFISKANEISSKILNLIIEETKNFECQDDPADQIYLGVHTLGNLSARILITLNNYGQIYGIPNLDKKLLSKWIKKITDEHVRVYEKGK